MSVRSIFTSLYHTKDLSNLDPIFYFTKVYTMQSKAVVFPGCTSESEEDTPPQLGRKVLDENSPRAGHKNSTDSPGEGFGQSLLDAGIGRKLVKEPSTRPGLTSSTMKKIGSSSRLEIMALLEEWEEPEIKANSASKATIRDILQFRQAVSLMDDTYPFTPGK